jgi:hypothetical protein
LTGVRAVIAFSLKGKLERVTLPPVFTVGRAPSSDLVIDHPFVSALHCTFFLEPKGVALVDHESSNGTIRNGARIHGKAPLEGGDVIEIGPVVMTLSLVEDDPVTAGAATVPRPAMMLGLAMKTQTERPPEVRAVIEVVDGGRRGDARFSFRDAVATRAGTVAIAGDLTPCKDDGEVLGALRRELRALATAGARPGAIAIALSHLLRARERSAQLVIACIEAGSSRAIWVNAHQGGPSIVRGDGSLLRLEGERATTPLGSSDEPEAPEEQTFLEPGSVLVIPSSTLVSTLRTLWDLDRPFLPKERRAAAVAIWLTNQAVRTAEGGSAVCIEISSA